MIPLAVFLPLAVFCLVTGILDKKKWRIIFSSLGILIILGIVIWGRIHGY